MKRLKKYLLFLLTSELLFACGSPEKDLEETPVHDSTEVYMEEQKGKDPAEFPCGLKGRSDTFTTHYQGSPLTIKVIYDCPDVIPMPADPAEQDLKVTDSIDNMLKLDFHGKKFDTSFVLMKKYFADSLGNDFLSESVFGNLGFQEISGKENFIFNVFVGRPYSDDGLNVTFELNRKKGIHVLSSDLPDFGEPEAE